MEIGKIFFFYKMFFEKNFDKIIRLSDEKREKISQKKRNISLINTFMFSSILYPWQQEILPLLWVFWKNFYLAGWTAIALQIWHRKSIDFDLFCREEIKNNNILLTLKKHGFSVEKIFVDNPWEELTLMISWTKVTFLYYPFDIYTKHTFQEILLPDIPTLAAMKFYTLWRRGKWKDYVDIYHIFQKWYSLSDISDLAEKIFAWWYNEKLLREQLCYFEDIDFSEEVEYIWESISQVHIQKSLQNYAIQ